MAKVKIDFEEVNTLLNVVHQCATVGPKLTALGNAAMTELTKMNDSIVVAARENKVEAPAEQLDLSGKPTEPNPDKTTLVKRV